jgi:hypothetical protein
MKLQRAVAGYNRELGDVMVALDQPTAALRWFQRAVSMSRQREAVAMLAQSSQRADCGDGADPGSVNSLQHAPARRRMYPSPLRRPGESRVRCTSPKSTATSTSTSSACETVQLSAAIFSTNWKTSSKTPGGRPAAGQRQGGVIGTVLCQRQSQELPEREAVRTPPGDAALGVDPLEVADQQHAEVIAGRDRALEAALDSTESYGPGK